MFKIGVVLAAVSTALLAGCASVGGEFAGSALGAYRNERAPAVVYVEPRPVYYEPRPWGWGRRWR